MTMDELQSLLASAQVSPHLSTIQNYCFVVVQEEFNKEALSNSVAAGQIVRNAAIILVLLVNQQHADDDTAIVDALMATYQLVLTAIALGWGYHLLLEFDRDLVKRIVKCPDSHQVIALIPIGKPAGEGYRGQMRKMDELAFKENYGSSFGLSSRE